MNYKLANFYKGLEELGIVLTETQINQFIKYFELMIEKNKVMNLTTITEFDEVVTKHFLDSLTLIKIVDIEKYKTVIDVGTGAGFPGIPLKIVYPHLEVTLLDSLNKKVKFLNEVCEELGLHGIAAIHARAEEGARDKWHREKYDICVSRAVANLSTLSEYCVPFVRVGGYFVPYKAGNVDKELFAATAAIKKLCSRVVDKVEFTLPGSDITRVLISIKKDASINKKYPRKAGLPSKEPLI